jgi:hypothetical protein
LSTASIRRKLVGRSCGRAIALGVAIGVVVLWYGRKALWCYAKEGTEKPIQEPSETMKAAQVVATAIRESSAASQGDAVGRKQELAVAFRSGGNSLL